MVLEVQGQAGARHDAAGEEVAAHPVVCVAIDEGVRHAAVHEDVQEELSLRSQPPADAREEAPVVAHVLEHLDRHDPVETLVDVEIVHVAGQHLDVAASAPARLCEDELALRLRIGNGDDRGIRVAGRHI